MEIRGTHTHVRFHTHGRWDPCSRIWNETPTSPPPNPKSQWKGREGGAGGRNHSEGPKASRRCQPHSGAAPGEPPLQELRQPPAARRAGGGGVQKQLTQPGFELGEATRWEGKRLPLPPPPRALAPRPAPSPVTSPQPCPGFPGAAHLWRTVRVLTGSWPHLYPPKGGQI